MVGVQVRIEQARYAMGQGVTQRRAYALMSVARSGLVYLEHCQDRYGTLLSMMKVLRVGGKIYLSFSCEQSVFFPNRDGTLNYYDDSSHQLAPPSFEKVSDLMEKNGFEISYSTRNYKPRILWFLGLLNEPISRYKGRNLIGTWEFQGFESIFIATKIK
jgi:hypothetical protein